MQQFQKLRGFAVLTGIVTTLALASSTLAEPPAPGGGGGGGPGQGGPGQGGPGQGGPGRGGRPEFKDVDKNGDGFITEDEVPAERWERPYGRQLAAFPAGEHQQRDKLWPAVARIDNAYGDRNLICTCPSVEELADRAPTP
jgi:hypothetical protein